MQRPLTLLFLLVMLPPIVAVADDATGDDRLSPEPLRDLDRTHQIRLVYFVAADREPVDDWQQRIETLMTFVNDAIRRDLVEKGYETDGFDFEFDDDDSLAIHLIHGDEPASHYNGAPDYHHLRQWRTIQPEVEAELGSPDRALHMVFVETYDDGPAPHEWPGTNAQAAFLSPDAGAAMMSAWILRPEFTATTIERQLELLFDDTPIDGRTAHGHGRQNSPRHHFIEDGFGAVIHELGHALSLYHDHRDPLYHMGNGFRQLRTRYRADLSHDQRSRFSDIAARFMAQSRFLKAVDEGSYGEAPVMSVGLMRQPQPGDEHIALRIEAHDDEGLAAAVFYTAANDSVATGIRLDGTELLIDEFRVPHPRMEPGQEITLQARIIDTAGNIGTLSLQQNVAGEE